MPSIIISMLQPFGEGPAPSPLVKTPRQADMVTVSLFLTVSEEFSYPSLSTPEDYSLTVVTVSAVSVEVRVSARTYFGLRHGLETVSQLVSWSNTEGAFQMHGSASILNDSPSFGHRGISVDTSRNFMPVSVLKRTLDAMAASKLNVLHWHITDSQSFPLVLPTVPKLAQYGVYHDSMVYTPSDVSDLVEYALLRGVRIVPELDTPAHAANGWQFGDLDGLGSLALCINLDEPQCRGGVCGILNPTNPNLYPVLKDTYKDLLTMFPSDTFHMGGDEVNFTCWENSPEIKAWFDLHGLEGTEEDMFGLWVDFQKNASVALQEAAAEVDSEAKRIVLWTSSLTDRGDTAADIPPEDYVIQIWSDSTEPGFSRIVNQGYPVIVSSADFWYLDCGHGNWADKRVSHCDPFKQWRDVYDFDPVAAYLAFPDSEPERVGQILGGEVAVWSEMIGSGSFDGRVWPRAAAAAERLWTSPLSDWTVAERRFVHHRERLVQRGVHADAVQMYWCHQNEGRCRLF